MASGSGHQALAWVVCTPAAKPLRASLSSACSSGNGRDGWKRGISEVSVPCCHVTQEPEWQPSPGFSSLILSNSAKEASCSSPVSYKLPHPAPWMSPLFPPCAGWGGGGLEASVLLLSTCAFLGPLSCRLAVTGARKGEKENCALSLPCGSGQTFLPSF